MNDKGETCNLRKVYQTTQFISLNEHISNDGETEWTSVEFECLSCGELFRITYTPKDAEAVTKSMGRSTFKNMQDLSQFKSA